MQENFLDYNTSFSGQKVLCGLSGGINSMAVLCWLALLPKEFKPLELHLFYAHFSEHSKDTFKFVADGIRYARKHFDTVLVKITKNSVNKYFIKNNWIPHPTKSPCSRELKIEPMQRYIDENNIDIDLIGYVREEKKRIKRQQGKVVGKYYPISHFSEADCFALVKQEIGYYPFIYDIKDSNNKQVFLHNNCLPCKNMANRQLEAVKEYFPGYWAKAKEVEEKTGSYWGRLPVINSCDYCLFD